MPINVKKGFGSRIKLATDSKHRMDMALLLKLWEINVVLL